MKSGICKYIYSNSKNAIWYGKKLKYMGELRWKSSVIVLFKIEHFEELLFLTKNTLSTQNYETTFEVDRRKREIVEGHFLLLKKYKP